MHRVHTKTSHAFTRRFQRISHLCSTRSSTLNFSKPKLKLTKTKYRISTRGLTMRSDFVEDFMKSIEKTRLFKVKMKPKLLTFDDEKSYF